MSINLLDSKLYKVKSISLLLIICLTFSFCCGDMSIAETVESHTEHDNSVWYNYNNIYAASSIAFMGAEWSSARQCWEFNYRFVGTGAARYVSTGNPSDQIRFAIMEIEGIENNSNLALFSSTDSKYIGSAPESGTGPNYSGVAGAVTSFAITVINSLGLSYAWSVAGLLAAFCSTVDAQESKEDYLYRQWEWSGDISDTGQFFWFLADVEPNQTVRISYDYMLIGPGYELLKAGKGTRKLIAPGPSSQSRVANWNPGMMSDSDKERYGLEEIKAEDLDKRASELNLTSQTIDEFNKSGEEIFYFAHDVIEYDTTFVDQRISDQNLTKTFEGTTVNELNAEIEKNEILMKAYSLSKYHKEEGKQLIQTLEEYNSTLQSRLLQAY